MSDWKSFVKTTLFGACKYSGVLHASEALVRAFGQPFMTVLLFHRVTDAIPEDGLTVSTAHFRGICRLLRRSFRVVPLGEVFRIVRGGEPMPRRTVAITFDDCYRNNLFAARVLAEQGLPATFFLPTGFVQTERVFPWDRHLPRMPNLSWEDVRELVRLGMEVGSHTISHADLGAIGPDEARTELVGSRAVLEERLGQSVRWFAYPYGGTEHLRQEYIPIIREAGYEGAVSAFGGFVRPGCDDRVLPREAVPYFRSLAHLEMHLTGCLHWWYALRGRGQTPLPSVGRAVCPAGEPVNCGPA